MVAFIILNQGKGFCDDIYIPDFDIDISPPQIDFEYKFPELPKLDSFDTNFNYYPYYHSEEIDELLNKMEEFGKEHLRFLKEHYNTIDITADFYLMGSKDDEHERNIFMIELPLLGVNGKDADYYNVVGVKYFNLKQYNDALESIKKGIKLGCSKPWICQYNYNLAYQYTNHFKGMEQEYTRLISQKEDFVETYIAYADFKYMNADYEEAKGIYTEALYKLRNKQNDGTAISETLKQDSPLFERKGYNGKASRYFPYILKNIGDIFSCTGEYETAHKFYEKSNTMKQNLYAYTWDARAYLGKKDSENFKSCCQTHNDLNARDIAGFDSNRLEVKVMSHLCESLGEEGDYPDFQVLKEYASSAFDNGEYDLALEYYLAASYVEPDNSTMTYNIALTCRNLGKVQNAVFYFNHYLYQEPEARDRDEVLKMVDEMLE